LHEGKEKGLRGEIQVDKRCKVNPMDFDTARNLGLIGSILIIAGIVLGLIPWIGLLLSILALAGLILVLVSLYLFSKIYAEPRIFRDALISVIVLIAGVIVAILLLIILVGVAFVREVRSSPPGGAPPEISITAVLGSVIVAFLIALVAYAISAFFWYRTLNTLSRVSGEGMFRTAGLLYAISVLLHIIGVFTSFLLDIIGVFTLIILVSFLFILLGSIAAFFSWIALTLAFYNVKQPQQTPPQPAMPAVPA